MNYKQTQQFNERKTMILMLLANNPLDLDEMGTLVRIKQIEKKLGIKKAALYRCLHSLENDGMIICTHHGYQTGINSKRWLITDQADKILKDENNICKFCELTLDYYKSFNENRTKPLVIEGGNIGYNQHHLNNNLLNIIINKINLLVIENNEYSKIKNMSNLRYVFCEKSKKYKIKGRVFNALCFTKSGKKQRYMKSDKRLFRTEYLNYKGLPDYEEVFDIKSQIPRLTYILQGGNYDDIEDFYSIGGIERQIVKKLSMNTYFDKSKATGTWHTCRWFLLKYFDKEQRQNKEIKEKAKEQFKKWFGTIWDYYSKLFTPIGSEIFLWTSLWEQLIIKEAREQLGVHIVNVYDGFYYNDYSIKDALNKIAGETSAEVRRLYTEIKNMETAEFNVA